MAVNVAYKIPRGTRANLNSLAGSSGLIVGQPYILTDEAGRMVVALTTSTYAEYTMPSDVSDTVYGGGWNGDTKAPSKNAVYDRLELLATRGVGASINGMGSPVTTGFKGYIPVPLGLTIEDWTLLSDVSTTAVVDIWMDTYANYPPVVGDVITASAKPTLTAQNKNTSSTLTGWTTAIATGDVLGINVNSNNNATILTLMLKCRVT